MKETEFIAIVAKGKRYTIDVTLREAGESYHDFIARAKHDDLGVWVDEKYLINNETFC